MITFEVIIKSTKFKVSSANYFATLLPIINMINQHLLELYTQHESRIWEIKSRCDSDQMNGPFLISPNDTYTKSVKKIAFIGQETNGWSNKNDVLEQMTTYIKFNLGEAYYSSPFWSVIRKIEMALTGSVLSSAWLNLNKYDQARKAPSTANRVILSELDFLLLEELKLIAPDVVIFLTGPHYDRRVSNLLKGEMLPVEGFNQRKLCQIVSTEITGKIFRTYHPHYLRRSRFEKVIIEAITAQTVSNTTLK